MSAPSDLHHGAGRYELPAKLRIKEDEAFDQIGQLWREVCRLAARLEMEVSMLAFSIAVKTGQDLRGRGIDVEVLDGLRQEPLPRAIVKYVQYINERRAAMQAEAQGPAASAKAKGQAATVPGPEPEVTSEGDVHDDGPTIEGEDYDKNEPADQRPVKHVRIQSSPGHFPR